MDVLVPAALPARLIRRRWSMFLSLTRFHRTSDNRMMSICRFVPLLVSATLLLAATRGTGQITLRPPLTVTVNSTVPTHDANLSDNVCADSNRQCTLRAAIEQTNNYVGRGPDTIQFDIPTTDAGDYKRHQQHILLGSAELAEPSSILARLT